MARHPRGEGPAAWPSQNLGGPPHGVATIRWHGETGHPAPRARSPSSAFLEIYHRSPWSLSFGAILPLPRIAGKQCDDFLFHALHACRDVERRAGRQKDQDVI